MEIATKNRVRLWLRGERAFGLSSVPIANNSPTGAAEIECEPTDSSPACDTFAGVEEPNEMAPRGGLVAPPKDEKFAAKKLPSGDKASRLIALNNNEVRGCTRCRLHEQRTNTVFGEGNVDAKIVFVGEGPGENEDLQGRPFVGRAGEQLNKWIGAMGLKREDVYIANIVKCRPPGNREPAPDEVATCTPYLERQIEIIRPSVIVTLGRPALQYMLQQKVAITKMRGTWQEWRGIKLMPTFHPAYVLRNATYETRSAVWSDLQAVMKELGMSLPTKREQE
jgi:uracil-DNA glycosylase